MKNFYLFVALLCATQTYAQLVTIKDQQTQEPIPFASLNTPNGKKYTTADNRGKADVSVFREDDQIEIRNLGYKTIYLEFSDFLLNDYVIFMETSNLNLDEVVLSANKWRQSSRDVPEKTLRITPEEVLFQNPQTAADLLGISGGVYIQKSQQGGGSPMIRGYATNRLLYSVDGVRMNSAIFRAGNIQNVINLDPFVMESTEIVFGPGSVIYGSDAIGGVMSFNTLKPKFSFDETPYITGKGIARYSSANQEKTGHFDVNVGFKKWSFVSSISHWDFNHLRQGSHGPKDYIRDYHVQNLSDGDVVIKNEDPLLQIPTGYSQTNFMQKFRFQPNSHVDINYGFHYSETSPYGRYDRHLRERNGTARYAEWDYGPQIWMLNNLGVKFSNENVIFDQLHVQFAHQWFEESRLNRDLNKPDLNVNAETVFAYSFNADFIKSLNEKHTLFYGLEYVLDDVKSTGEIRDVYSGTVEPGASRYPKSSWQSMAAYITDQFKPNEKVTLQAGLRYNHIVLDAEFDTTFYPFPFTEAELNHGALTGSIGAVYRPDETWEINTNFGTAFRSPNIDDVGKVFDSAPGLVVVPNPDLKPEYAYNIDLGIAKIIENKVKVEVTGYYSHLKKSMLRLDYQLNGQDSILYQGEMSKVQAIQNSAVANIYGVQAGVEADLSQGFKFLTQVNFQKGEEELENGEVSPVRHAAPFFGISRLRFNHTDLKLEMNVVFTGERSYDNMPIGELSKTELYAVDKNGNLYAPAWYTLNFKSNYQLNENVGLNFGIENITDRRYRPFASGISGAGRNFVMSVIAQF